MRKLSVIHKTAWAHCVIFFLIGALPCAGSPVRSKVNAHLDSRANAVLARQVVTSGAFYRSSIASQLNTMGLASAERMNTLNSMSDSEVAQMVQNQDVTKLVGESDSGDIALAILLVFFFLAMLASAGA